jgi:hypothetical protein
MNTKITVSMVAAAVMAISVAFVPASADERDEAAAAPVQGTVVAAAETPQEAVWDMTYGAERPVLVASVDGTPAQEEETVDLSMG